MATEPVSLPTERSHVFIDPTTLRGFEKNSR